MGESGEQAAEGLDAIGPDGARWGFTRRARGNERPGVPADGEAVEDTQDGEEADGDEEEVRVAPENEDRARQLMTEIGEVSADVEDTMQEIKRARVRDRIYEKLSDWAHTHESKAEWLSSKGDLGTAAERRHCAAELRKICERFLETTETSELAALVDEADPFDPDDERFTEELDASADQPKPVQAPPGPPSLLDTLRQLKARLGEALAGDDAPRILELLQELADMKLKWDPVREAAIGKEVGLAAKHSDPAVVEQARAIISALHRLARSAKAGNSYGR